MIVRAWSMLSLEVHIAVPVATDAIYIVGWMQARYFVKEEHADGESALSKTAWEPFTRFKVFRHNILVCRAYAVRNLSIDVGPYGTSVL